MTKKKSPDQLLKVGRKPVPLEQRHQWTLDEIRHRCGADNDTECWDHYVGMYGQEPRKEHLRRYPSVVHGGVMRVLLRRLAWLLLHGEDPPEGMVLVMTRCDNPYCQNPHHAVPMWEAQKCKRAAEKGAFSSPARALKIAARKQAKGKRNWDKVAQIRACTIAHKQEPWKLWDISETMWKRIRSYRAWKPADSPFLRMVA